MCGCYFDNIAMYLSVCLSVYLRLPTDCCSSGLLPHVRVTKCVLSANILVCLWLERHCEYMMLGWLGNWETAQF